MKIASSAYKPLWHEDWAPLQARLDHWIGGAAAGGARLALFPEYAGCEAALLGAPQGDPAPKAWRDRMAEVADRYAAMVSSLAQKHGIYVLAGSLCARDAEAGFVNRAYLCGPEGGLSWQDKLILTPYEREKMEISPGAELKCFDTALGRVGILICYDSEFPLLARRLVEEGVDLILVPSATDYPAGQTRVRQSCRARAIESQCLIVQAPVLGGAAGCDILDLGTGRAAAFSPPDHGLPSDGIIAQGDTDVEGWVIFEADPAQIASPRKGGQVGNVAHWPEQDERLANVSILQVT
jgi:predicted amidohydrolase